MEGEDEPPRPSGGGERGGRSRWWRWALQLVVVAAAFGFTAAFLRDLEWHELAGRLRDARAVPLLGGALLLLLRFVVWDLRWRLAFASLGPVPSVWTSFFGLLGAVFANLVTPSARVLGGLLRARYVVRRSRQTFGRVYGVVLFDQVTHQVVMAIVTWLAVLAMTVLLGRPRWAGVGLVLLVVVVAFAGRWLGGREAGQGSRLARWMTRRGAARQGRMGEVLEHGSEAVDALHDLLIQPRLRLQAVLLSVLFFLLNAGGAWMAFVALGRPASLLAVMVALALGTAAGALTGTPGGLGTTEAGMVLSLVLLGVDEVDAAAGTLLFRGLHYGLVLVLGLPALLWFEARGRRGTTERDDAPEADGAEPRRRRAGVSRPGDR